MTTDEGPDSLILCYLRNIDGRLGCIENDTAEVKMRLGHTEKQITGLQRVCASLLMLMDRLANRPPRVERRPP